MSPNATDTNDGGAFSGIPRTVSIRRKAPPAAAPAPPPAETVPVQQKTRIAKRPDTPVERTPDPPPPSLQKLLEITYDAVIITDSHGRIGQVNARAEELFQYPRDQLLTLRVTSLIDQASDALIARLQSNLDEQRYTLIEAYCRRADGERFASEIAVSQNTLDLTGGFCFFFRNIASRKFRENQLVTAHNAVMNAADGIVVTGVDGRITFTNPSFLTLWGYTGSQNLNGKDLRILFQKPEDLDPLLQAALGGRVQHGESQARKPDGTNFPVALTLAPNLNTDDIVTGLVISVEDISDRHRAQASEQNAVRERIEAERVKARLDMLSELGYAINDPLQNLLSMAEIEKNDLCKAEVARVIAVVKEFRTKDTLGPAEKRVAAAPVPPAPARELVPCAPRTILLVDDEAMILRLFTQVLSSSMTQVNISQAANGAKALESFAATHQAIVITDLHMPGTDGEQVYRQIEKLCREKNWAQPHVVFCTGFAPPSTIVALAEDGHTSILIKPVGIQQLLHVVTQVMPLSPSA